MEVFPGATGCEEADYVVLNLHRDQGDVEVQIHLRDACHTADDYYYYVGQGLDAGDNGTFLQQVPMNRYAVAPGAGTLRAGETELAVFQDYYPYQTLFEVPSS